jgi:hypothetical protein
MADTQKAEIEPYWWYQIIIGIPILFLMIYAGLIGFIFAGVRYGFMAGMESFDEFFETAASKHSKS